jgi:hypothetical protein
MKYFAIKAVVCVDSGQLMITDPCYLSKWKDGDFKGLNVEPTNNYAEACNASLSEKGHGQILKGLSLAFSSGYGDGLYDVVATKDREGRIIKVEIDMSL